MRGCIILLLANKTAVVTGATRGIGKKIALTLAEEGSDLVINGTKEYLLKEVKRDIENFGRECIVVSGDISDRKTSKLIVEEAISNFSKIDILVNNAGIIKRDSTEEMDLSDWDKVMNINLNGTLYMILEVLPYMKDQKLGKIINIASSAAKKPHPNASPSYGASKSAVVYLTRHFAAEMAKYGIYVNALCPGPIETDMSKDWDLEYRKKVIQKIPLGKLGKARDVAQGALFLASSMSNFITGEAININGGSFMD